MAKFFVDPAQITGAHIYLEDKDDIKHLLKVLRSKIGDSVSVSDGDAWEYETEIEDINPDCVTLKIVDSQKFATEPDTRVTLYQGVPKAQKMELIIQKCVELGVDSIVPVFMERTVVVEKGNFGKKLDRWQKISDEAVKQCKRGKIPKIHENISSKEMLKELDTNGYDLVLCAYESEDQRSIKDALRAFDGKDKPVKIALIIGPEGGFSKEEIDGIKELGSEIVTLGKTILRTETAGLAALSMIMYELEI